MPLVEQEVLTLPEHPSSPPPILSGVRVALSLVFCVVFCISLFFWPLCCLFFFDFQILTIPLVSSNSFYLIWKHIYFWILVRFLNHQKPLQGGTYKQAHWEGEGVSRGGAPAPMTNKQVERCFLNHYSSIHFCWTDSLIMAALHTSKAKLNL